MEFVHKWGKRMAVILPLTAMGKMTTVSNHDLWTFEPPTRSPMTDTPRSQHVWPAVGSLRARSCKSVSWKVSYQTATGILMLKYPQTEVRLEV